MVYSTYARLPSQSSAIELSKQRRNSTSNNAAEPLHLPQVNRPASTADAFKSSRFSQRFSGWRFGVASTFTLLLTVLFINTIFMIWAIKTYGTHDGIGIMFSGSCQKTRSLSTWLHLAINVLGTAMLSGSNYCAVSTAVKKNVANERQGMQRLCAPTREELDRAHARKLWVDIGITSFRNLRIISKSRLVVWILLALSSVPIHLL